eukprot:IDg6742t1
MVCIPLPWLRCTTYSASVSILNSCSYVWAILVEGAVFLGRLAVRSPFNLKLSRSYSSLYKSFLISRLIFKTGRLFAQQAAVTLVLFSGLRVYGLTLLSGLQLFGIVPAGQYVFFLPVPLLELERYGSILIQCMLISAVLLEVTHPFARGLLQTCRSISSTLSLLFALFDKISGAKLIFCIVDQQIGQDWQIIGRDDGHPRANLKRVS